MIINEVSIENFRKFRNIVSFNLSNEVLLVGKNNTGKTSISELFQKFLSNKGSFSFQDFNYLSFSQEAIDNVYAEYLVEKAKPDFNKKEFIDTKQDILPSIKLSLEIEISNNDDFSILKNFFYEFDNNERILLLCSFELNSLENLINDYESYTQKIDAVNEERDDDQKLVCITLYEYLIRNINSFYSKKFYSTKKDDERSIVVDADLVSSLFHIELINARRDVDDTADQRSNNISIALWEYFSRLKNTVIHNDDYFKKAKELIRSSLDVSYADIFEELLTTLTGDVLFSEDYDIEISSDFDIETILKRNSKLRYRLGDVDFSESYNGLGISNLIYIFIRIQLFLLDTVDSKKPINILFLEEPESHLHPQLQSTFLNKVIKPLLVDENIINIISTHSSYILSGVGLDSVKYFCDRNNTVKIKSLQSFLEKNDRFEKFIKKYFTVKNCDLFFADKAIFIEGMSERLLLPQFINKNDEADPSYNLGKQNITIIEVGGRYANIFYDLLNFLELPTLVITDIDTIVGRESCKCSLINETPTNLTIKTSNPLINNWFPEVEDKFVYNLLKYKDEVSHFIKTDENGVNRRLAFQLPEADSLEWGRTLEEQVILENSEIFANDIKQFWNEDNYEGSSYKSLIDALVKLDGFSEIDLNSLEISEIIKLLAANRFEIVKKIEKTDFALDLIASEEEWLVPKYIKDGLLWLMR